MSKLTPREQSENVLLNQWATSTMGAVSNATITLTTGLGWLAFGDTGWVPQVQAQGASTVEITSIGATTILMNFTPSAVLYITGIGRA